MRARSSNISFSNFGILKCSTLSRGVLNALPRGVLHMHATRTAGQTRWDSKYRASGFLFPREQLRFVELNLNCTIELPSINDIMRPIFRVDASIYSIWWLVRNPRHASSLQNGYLETAWEIRILWKCFRSLWFWIGLTTRLWEHWLWFHIHNSD